MFTILETIRGRPQDNALVITEDKLLRDGILLLVDEYQTGLEVVQNFEQAREHIYSKIDAWYRDTLRKESEQAKDVLLGFREQIAAQVGEIRELSDSDLGVNWFVMALAGSSRERLNIRKVVSLSFADIESALWKDRDKPASRILFKIRCDAKVLAAEAPLPRLLDSTKYQVGGEVTYTGFFGEPAVSERVLPVPLYGEALLTRKNGDWDLRSMKVDKAPPEPADLDWLYRIEGPESKHGVRES